MYVMRNEEGSIVGCFANKQPGIADEFVKEPSEELIDFYTRLNSAGAKNDD